MWNKVIICSFLSFFPFSKLLATQAISSSGKYFEVFVVYGFGYYPAQPPTIFHKNLQD